MGSLLRNLSEETPPRESDLTRLKAITCPLQTKTGTMKTVSAILLICLGAALAAPEEASSDQETRVVGKKAAVAREELEAYIKKNEAALAALQSDQEAASADTDERLAAAALALAATKEALQAVIDEEPWALALAATEEELSATRERLDAVESAASEIDLKVTALQAEVENLDLGYKVVTSGRNCKYITTKEECLEATKVLGFAVTRMENSGLSPRRQVA